jgi:threonyl-tRNA synthetase
VLIEHYGGAFPVWLAPVQAVVIPVAPAFDDYARSVKNRLAEAGIRVDADLRDARMNAKIRDAQQQKVPYMLVVGGREQEERTVSIRVRTGDKKDGTALEDAVSFIQDKIETREDI